MFLLDSCARDFFECLFFFLIFGIHFSKVFFFLMKYFKTICKEPRNCLENNFYFQLF